MGIIIELFEFKYADPKYETQTCKTSPRKKIIHELDEKNINKNFKLLKHKIMLMKQIQLSENCDNKLNFCIK